MIAVRLLDHASRMSRDLSAYRTSRVADHINAFWYAAPESLTASFMWFAGPRPHEVICPMLRIT
ncbi:hypothetical protein JOF29_006934 [Kribbella aluminosa]|uniref:Uncharacterized protein n=1 Tax=Kribbella aluminosa TaxID=416017 RepID=A0ABS4UWB7_9ACTN|nr:hypothetical protein [Kribbella aluminosa]MBP2355824.1 hypothetical protein [Kribbella aluminosa]